VGDAWGRRRLPTSAATIDPAQRKILIYQKCTLNKGVFLLPLDKSFQRCILFSIYDHAARLEGADRDGMGIFEFENEIVFGKCQHILDPQEGDRVGWQLVFGPHGFPEAWAGSIMVIDQRREELFRFATNHATMIVSIEQGTLHLNDVVHESGTTVVVTPGTEMHIRVSEYDLRAFTLVQTVFYGLMERLLRAGLLDEEIARGIVEGMKLRMQESSQFHMYQVNDVFHAAHTVLLDLIRRFRRELTPFERQGLERASKNR
jgi:hypothetical protein